MKSDYPFPDKCEKCIHNDVCYMVGECLNHIPDFECDRFEEKRPHGEWLSHYEYCKKHDCIPSGLIALWWCSQCEQGVEHPTNFCPNCGSDNRKRGEAE